MTSTKITVAICTWNRATLLDKTLDAFRHLSMPTGMEWEVIVVNNNCTDNTDEVIAKHASALPLRRILEPKPGLSNARNRAVAEATGDLILWTDDDVLASSRWMEEYAKAAAQWPEAGYFGGTIEPWFEKTPPAWITENLDLLLGPFVIHRLGDFVGPFTGDHVPFGANMAFRRQYLIDNPFDPNLGYKGSAAVGGEETTLFANLRSQGVKGIWVGTASVRHYIPAPRMTADYISKWFSGFGQSMARIGGHAPAHCIAGMPRWAIRQYVTHRFQSFLVAPISARIWLKHFTTAAQALGVIKEYRSCAAASR